MATGAADANTAARAAVHVKNILHRDYDLKDQPSELYCDLLVKPAATIVATQHLTSH